MARLKRLKNARLAIKIFCLFTSVVIFLFACSGLMLYAYFKNNIESSLKESLALVVQNNAEYANDLFARVNAAIEMINGNESQIVRLLHRYDGNIIEGARQYEQAKNLFSDIMGSTIGQAAPYYAATLLVDGSMALSEIISSGAAWPQLKGMSIYRAPDAQGGESAGAGVGKGAGADEWYGKTIALDGGAYWFKRDEKPNSLYVSRLLSNNAYIDRRLTHYTLGVILIEMDMSWITGRINTSRLTENTRVFLADGNRRVIYASPEAGGEGRPSADGSANAARAAGGSGEAGGGITGVAGEAGGGEAGGGITGVAGEAGAGDGANAASEAGGGMTGVAGGANAASAAGRASAAGEAAEPDEAMSLDDIFAYPGAGGPEASGSGAGASGAGVSGAGGSGAGGSGNARDEMQYMRYGGEGYWLNRSHLHGLDLYTLIPAADISRLAGGISRITGIVSVAGACVGVALVTAFSFLAVRPITRLSSHMRHNETLTPIDCGKAPNDEVGDLYSCFNELVGRTRLSMQEQINSEMRVLQARINPHFLYNTLDTVCYMALVQGSGDIADALSSLAAFTRHSISDPDETVSLCDEIEVLEHYIKIQRLRLGDKLSVDFEYDIDTLGYRIPKLIIQPLIENAIAHNAHMDYIDIEVRIYIDAGFFCIAVSDNGAGADADAINLFLGGADTLKCSSGYGIRNIHRRLRMKYGDMYGLSYKKNEPAGLRAVASLPAPNSARLADAAQPFTPLPAPSPSPPPAQ